MNGDGYSDVIVGAYLFNKGQKDEGRAYVYMGSPTGLSLSPAWITESNQTFATLQPLGRDGGRRERRWLRRRDRRRP